MAEVHTFLMWRSEVSEVRTSTPAYIMYLSLSIELSSGDFFNAFYEKLHAIRGKQLVCLSININNFAFPIQFFLMQNTIGGPHGQP